MSVFFAERLDHAGRFRGLSYGDWFRLPPEVLRPMQIRGLNAQLNRLSRTIPALRRLLTDTGITRLDTFEDGVRLLLPHTAFKSYPLAWLDQGQFGRLTRWLDQLTSVDLSAVKCDRIETIDDWISVLDRTTQLRLLHTFGTTGKLSLIPHTVEEWERGAYLVADCLRDWRGPGAGPDLRTRSIPIVQPFYRYGASAAQRGNETLIRLFAGGDDNALFLYPEGRFSADIASLAGRLQAADARGESAEFKLSARLRSIGARYAAQEKRKPQLLRNFFAEAVRRYSGSDVYLLAVWPVLYAMAEEGLSRGIHNVFGAGSVLQTSGGTKGATLPSDFRETVMHFLGTDLHYDFYAMSEFIAICPRCEAGQYHVPPVLIPFVIDGATGKPLPRDGRQTGRFAAIDLLPDSYWSGVISGDRVTIAGWDSRCECGRFGPYVEPTITRYGEAEGGDDKINCAGTLAAHRRAIDYLTDLASEADA